MPTCQNLQRHRAVLPAIARHLVSRSVELAACRARNNSVTLLARDSIYAIARSLLTPVRPSVRLSVPLSVTRVDQSKTVKVRITHLSPQSSPMTLVS